MAAPVAKKSDLSTEDTQSSASGDVDIPGGSASGSEVKSAAQKKAERMNRLKNLHLRRNEARKMNHVEVVEEDRRNKLPANHEAQKRRSEWILKDEEERKAAAARGEDYDRMRLLDVSAEDAERFEKKKKKRNPDQGFADYEQATFRQYQRLTKQMKPDLQNYEKQKEKLGEDLYPDQNTLTQVEFQDTEDGINRMVEDLEKQIEKKAKYSRRRAFNEEDDVDYINERNMRFNKKIERFYGKYTAEIKQNLERGTAV